MSGTVALNPARRRVLSWKKRLAFLGIMLIGTYLFVELLAYLLLLVLYGGWATIEGMRDEARNDGVRSAGVDLLDAVIHPYVGYIHAPSPDPESLPPEQRINSYGFRDVAPPVHRRAADTFIVGVLGGSVAEEFGMYGMEHLQRALESSPKFSGKKVVPVRLGISGFKQPQQMLTVIYLLSLGAEFDAIVNLDGFNEVMLPPAENVPQNVFVAYPRSWQVITTGAGDIEILRVIGRITYFKIVRRNAAQWISKSVFAHSPTMNLMWVPFDEGLRKMMVADYHTLNSPERAKLTAGLSGPPLKFSNDDELYAYCVALWKQSSLQLHHVCAGNGIRYYHVLQPNQYLPDTKTMSAEEQKVAIDEGFAGRKSVEKGYPLLIREGADLARHGVRFHDFTRLFADHPEPIYRDECCHYNQHGNELLGRKLAQIINESF